METTLKLYIQGDGMDYLLAESGKHINSEGGLSLSLENKTNQNIPFPDKDNQIIISAFDYSADTMGGAPSITATVKCRKCLDDLWKDKKVYAEFREEKYYIMNTPSSSKDNNDERYSHDIELLSEREVLNHVYFIDAVQGDSSVDVYKSNSTNVHFFGDIKEFVSRLNSCFSYFGLDYTAVVDEGVTTEDKEVSFEDKYILDALQEIYNVFEIPYYFVGKIVHVGYTENAIPYIFKYGFDEALLSISKENANYAVINKIKGHGSTDNIPLYYPNESGDRAAIEASGKKWITPMTNLMPSIYRESEGAQQFYEARNNTYPDGEGGYYEFENEFSESNQRQGTTNFEDIKPTIVGMTNAAGQRIDMFTEFAYDNDDNDEKDDDGNYLHPYFFAKLRKFDGDNGFNLFEQAIESQTMQFSFTSGVCGACTFELGVGEETSKNIVQVDDNGDLKRDDKGNVLWENQSPQDRQNDTKNYEVWIALKKDDSTYGQIMPNKTQNLRPSTDDTFVILGINLPLAYITAAEKKLEQSLIKAMWESNKEKFTFSIKFSRIFFAEHPEVLEQLNENSRVVIEYNGQQHTLYVDNFSYKVEENDVLPDIEISLADTLSVGQNSLQTQLDAVKQDILSSFGGGDFLKQGLKYFLRKDVQDYAKKLITFYGGANFGQFIKSLTAGKGAGIDSLGNAEFESIRVRGYMEVMELIINRLSALEGDQLLSEADTIESVDILDNGLYRLHLKSKWDGYFTAQAVNNVLKGIINTLESGSGVYQTSWMLVNSVDTANNTIDVSLYPDIETPAQKNFPPCPMMNIARWGNTTDTKRQSCLYLSSTEGRIVKLIKVTKPIIDKTNYGAVLGTYPEFLDSLNLPLREGRDYMYVPGIITTDMVRIDYQGNPIVEYVDRGEWNASETYYFNELNPDTGIYETSDVWHKSGKYRCQKTGTKEEPSSTATDWILLQSGEKGEKGDRGATLRGPQYWKKTESGYQFYSGADGEPYIDIVVYNDNFYVCKKSHQKSDLNYPTSSFDNNNNLWQLSDKVDMIATNILLSTYALIENLGVKYVEINSTDGYIKQVDSDGKTIFLVQNGNVTCNKGTFNNIEVQSGQIAGFKVSGNDLTNDPFTNDASIVFRNDKLGAFAGIGGNILPPSSGARGVARFENHDTTDEWNLGVNYSMLVSAQGTLDNRAIQIDGGAVTGFAMKNKIISDSGKNVVLERFDYNVITINTGASCTITLPEMQIYDDGHVIRIKRLGSGGVNINIGQCYNYVDSVLKLTYPVIVRDQGDIITHTETLSVDHVCDSMELVWCRDLSYTVDGVKYYGAWVQYKMPRDW